MGWMELPGGRLGVVDMDYREPFLLTRRLEHGKHAANGLLRHLVIGSPLRVPPQGGLQIGFEPNTDYGHAMRSGDLNGTLTMHRLRKGGIKEHRITTQRCGVLLNPAALACSLHPHHHIELGRGRADRQCFVQVPVRQLPCGSTAFRGEQATLFCFQIVVWIDVLCSVHGELQDSGSL